MFNAQVHESPKGIEQVKGIRSLASNGFTGTVHHPNLDLLINVAHLSVFTIFTKKVYNIGSRNYFSTSQNHASTTGNSLPVWLINLP